VSEVTTFSTLILREIIQKLGVIFYLSRTW